ncbi:jouberin-like protein, partial [Dinothrombium tinctorium]
SSTSSIKGAESSESVKRSGLFVNNLSVTQSSPDIEVVEKSEENESLKDSSDEKSGQTQSHHKEGRLSLIRPKSFRKLLRIHSRFRKSKSEDTSSSTTESLLSPRQSPSLPRQSSCAPFTIGQSIDEAVETESDIFGVHIHNTDRKLKTSQTVLCPAVKVHIIDSKTGNYLLKRDANRNVVSYYENKNEKVNYIMPMMTQPCDLVNRIRYPRYPIWEELLVYNEDYSHFIKEDILIFFEILDFVGFTSEIDFKNSVQKKNAPWCYRVAWAFLRPVSTDGHLNTNIKLRLQLFKPLSESLERDAKFPQTTENGSKICYQGSLYVTIKSISVNEAKQNLKPSLRSLLPLQPEQAPERTSNNEQPSDNETVRSIPIWSKIEGQASKVPTCLWHELSAGNNRSCYIIKFSNDGLKIVCGASVFTAYMAKEKRSSIFLFELPSGNFLKRVNGFHLGTIYDLDWSKDDQMLVSASNDCTSQVWRLHKDHLTSLVLPHPCFVYSARFCPNDANLIFTGAYDGLIRLWSVKKSLEILSCEPQLLQELDGNLGQVLCLAFKTYPNSNALTLFSGGTKGNIAAFKQKDNKNDSIWCLNSRIRLKELHNVPINSIKIHPFGNKLIVYCRDGIQRVIDYKLEIVVQRCYGTLNARHLIRGCISPCGKYLFAGSEDGMVHVWNTDTGDKIYVYNDLPFKDSVTCVEYHPFDNIHTYDTKIAVKPSPARKAVLRKSHTVDESSRDAAKSKLKMQRAMRKLEAALRLGVSESGESK